MISFSKEGLRIFLACIVCVFYYDAYGALDSLLMLQDELQKLVTLLPKQAEWRRSLTAQKDSESEYGVLVGTGLIACHPTDPTLLAVAYQRGEEAYLRRLRIDEQGNIQGKGQLTGGSTKQLQQILWDMTDNSLSLFIESIESIRDSSGSFDAFMRKQYHCYDKTFRGTIEDLITNWNKKLLPAEDAARVKWLYKLYEQEAVQRRFILTHNTMEGWGVKSKPFYDINSLQFQAMGAYLLDHYRDTKPNVGPISVAYLSRDPLFHHKSHVYVVYKDTYAVFTILINLTKENDQIAFWPDNRIIHWNSTFRSLCLSTYSLLPIPEFESTLEELGVVAGTLLHAILSDSKNSITALATAGNTSFFVMLITREGDTSYSARKWLLYEVNSITQECVNIALPEIKLRDDQLAFNADGTSIFVVTAQGELLHLRRSRA